MTSYHNHTTSSDGQDCAARMAEAAARAGLSEVGLSDHLVVHPQGRAYPWAMGPERLGGYAAEVRRCAAEASLPVRLGIEADYFAETVEQTRRLLAAQPFDFVIGSVHFAGDFLVDAGHKRWALLTAEEREARWGLYWAAVAGMARSRAFDIAAHLDVPKRFGFKMLGETPAPALAALDAVAEAGMALELNTSGWSHPVQEPYPGAALLKQAHRRGIPILISADAHCAADVARSLGRGALLAREAGYTQTVRFLGRRRTFAPL